ncbi:MAG: fatty acid desaturase [Thermodesulfobacteriota bacterium]
MVRRSETSRPIARFLNGDELRALQHAPRRLALHVAPIYLAIVLVFAGLRAVATSGVAWLPWIAYPLAFVVVGWCQFAIVQALHEAAHQVLGRKTWGSTLAGMLMTYPLALTLQFRGQHLDHHRHFGDPDKDPDFDGYARFPRSKLALVAHLVRSATGIPAIVSFLRKSSDQSTLQAQGTTVAAELAKLVAAQAVVFALLTLALGPWHYVFLWALPLLTVVKLCTAARLLCEHGSPDKPFVWRSFGGTFVERNLLGAFGLNYHAEHHLYPTIPYENLAQVFRRHLDARRTAGAAADDDFLEVYCGGHLGLLRDWFRELPTMSLAASAPRARS